MPARSMPSRRTTRTPRTANAGRAPGRTLAWLRGPIPLIVISAAGVALRLWALRFQPTVTFDGTEYVRYGLPLARGHAVASGFSPRYPLLIPILHLLLRDGPAAAGTVARIPG